MTSVIVPCWNALELTRVCLERLLLRTTAPYELVLIDNGSSDGTGAWLRRFSAGAARRSPRSALRRVRVISNESNRGYPAAMNQGLGAARGELVLLGNADVAVAASWLEGMREALRAGGPKAVGVTAVCNPPRPPGKAIAWTRPPWYTDMAGLERHAAAAGLAPGPAFAPLDGFFSGFWFLARRAAIGRVGGFDESFSPGGFEDFDLQWRLRAAGGRLGAAPRCYVHHIGFACSERNGLRKRELYGRARAARFFAKHPQAPSGPMFR